MYEESIEIYLNRLDIEDDIISSILANFVYQHLRDFVEGRKLSKYIIFDYNSISNPYGKCHFEHYKEYFKKFFDSLKENDQIEVISYIERGLKICDYVLSVNKTNENADVYMREVHEKLSHYITKNELIESYHKHSSGTTYYEYVKYIFDICQEHNSIYNVLFGEN